MQSTAPTPSGPRSRSTSALMLVGLALATGTVAALVFAVLLVGVFDKLGAH